MNPFVLIKHLLELGYFRLFAQKKGFNFKGHNYRYFYALYNATWTSERQAEIPIFMHLLKENREKDILEVGNVLQHYFNVSHLILDKYEKGMNVINKDVVDFKSQKKYDLIISISTLEHVGFNHGEKEVIPDQPKKAINNLLKNLKKGGRLIFSFPIGYNPYLDEIVEKNDFGCKKTKFVIPVNPRGIIARKPLKLCIIELKK